MKAEVGIVMLHWHNRDTVLNCLRQLTSWSNLNWHLYLVNNDANSFSRPTILQNQFTLIEAGKNMGFAGGNNLGITTALANKCQYILLLNPDVEVSENTVILMKDFLANQKQYFTVGPALEESSGIHFGGKNPAIDLNTRCTSPPDDFEVDYVPGTVCLIKRQCFDLIGLLDEQYFFSGEIADLCYRVKLAGYKNGTISTTRAKHLSTSENLNLANLKIYYSFRNRFLFIAKHFSNHKKELFQKWRNRIWRQIFGAIFTLNFARGKVLWLALRDGHRGAFGNKNHYFFNSKS